MGEFLEKIMGKGTNGTEPPKWFRRDNLLILVLLGVLLFIIALPVKKETPATSAVDSMEQSKDGNVVQDRIRTADTENTEEYTAYLEEKLKKMLESIVELG